MNRHPQDEREKGAPGYGEGGEYPPDSPERGGVGGEQPEHHTTRQGGVGGEYPEKDQPDRGGMGGEYPEGEGVEEKHHGHRQ